MGVVRFGQGINAFSYIFTDSMSRGEAEVRKATSKSNVIYLNLLQNLAKISIIHISKQLPKYQHIIDYFDVALRRYASGSGKIR
jgi:hypothetical protein